MEMVKYKRHIDKYIPHMKNCDCWDCYDPYEDDDVYLYDECRCEGCNDWWSSKDCVRYTDMELYYKRKRRNDIIDDILNSDVIHHPELKGLYKKMRNDEKAQGHRMV